MNTWRYTLMMFWLAAAAAVANAPAYAPPSRPAAVTAQATATVRIVSGVHVRFDSPTNAGAPPAHDSKIMTDGTARPAKLVEFE